MNKKVILALVAVVLVIGVMVGVYFAMRPQPVEGEKEITVVVVHADGTEKSFAYRTTQMYLGSVLMEEKLVVGENSTYGLNITAVDGEEANWEKDQSYWAVYEGEDYASTGVDGIVLTDGGVYKLVYTRG